MFAKDLKKCIIYLQVVKIYVQNFGRESVAAVFYNEKAMATVH